MDLSGFNGDVVFSANILSNIGVLYSSCSVATAMATPFAGTDSYSSYGTKSVYQIKSLISIVDHSRQVAITSNSFTGCTGTKGIIYLDMNHVAGAARAVIASNTFT